MMTEPTVYERNGFGGLPNTPTPPTKGIPRGQTIDDLRIQKAAEKDFQETSSYFLKLLMTKMKMMDPLEPETDTAWVSQLAHFEQVNQGFKLNRSILDLIKLFKTSQSMQAMNMMDHVVETSGDRIQLKQPLALVEYFQLQDNAKDVIIQVKNNTGNVIYSEKVVDLPPGIHAFEWSGRDENGNPVAPGSYNVTIAALRDGQEIGYAVDMSSRPLNNKTFTVNVEDRHLTFSYVLPKGSRGSSISIMNQSGHKVWISPGETTPGKHTITWDGRDNQGYPVDDGTYYIHVTPRDNQGNELTGPRGESLPVPTTIRGKVQSIEQSPDGKTYITQNRYKVPLDAVIATYPDEQRQIKDQEMHNTYKRMETLLNRLERYFNPPSQPGVAQGAGGGQHPMINPPPIGNGLGDAPQDLPSSPS